MIEEDLLTRLPDAGYPTTIRPMPQIVQRAHQIRRVTRLYRPVGAVTGAAALAAVLSFTGLPFVGGTPDVQPGSGGSSDCSGGYAYAEQLSSMPELVYLPDVSTTGPLTGPVLARRETSSCAFVPPQAVAYSAKDGKVVKRLEIGPPTATNKYDFASNSTTEDGTFGGRITDPVIDGQPANVYGADGQDWLYMFWTAPDGTSRELSSEGLTRAEIIAVAGKLRFGEHGIADTSRPPAGFGAWADLPPMPSTATAAEQYRYAEFTFKSTGGEPGWILDVRDRPVFNVAPYGGQAVSIGGADGWWSPDDGGEPGHGRLTWLKDGVQFELLGNNAPMDMEQALDIAPTVVKAAPTDPRITAVGVK